MALSVWQGPKGNQWPLGYINVANNGTPVNIMSRVDANNNNAPGTAPRAGLQIAEYTPTCHKVTFQGLHPGANNNGMVYNSGFVYVMMALGPANGNSGGAQNRSDSGAMVFVLPPGGSVTIPADENDRAPISPYQYTIDADIDGEGALVTLLGCAR